MLQFDSIGLECESALLLVCACVFVYKCLVNHRILLLCYLLRVNCVVSMVLSASSLSTLTSSPSFLLAGLSKFQETCVFYVYKVVALSLYDHIHGLIRYKDSELCCCWYTPCIYPLLLALHTIFIAFYVCIQRLKLLNIKYSIRLRRSLFASSSLLLRCY